MGQNFLSSNSVLFLFIFVWGLVPPLAALFATWLEFSTKPDGKIFCLHFEVTSDALGAVMESGFARLPLRKFTKPSDSLCLESWFCRFLRQRVCHATSECEVCIWRRPADTAAGRRALWDNCR